MQLPNSSESDLTSKHLQNNALPATVDWLDQGEVADQAEVADQGDVAVSDSDAELDISRSDPEMTSASVRFHRNKGNYRNVGFCCSNKLSDINELTKITLLQ